jgi:predicted dehydrogenase
VAVAGQGAPDDLQRHEVVAHLRRPRDGREDQGLSDVEARKQVLVNYRRGDMRAPAIDNSEALAAELAEIAAALRGEASAAATGEDGLAIVAVLEAAGRSLATGGSRVAIS